MAKRVLTKEAIKPVSEMSISDVLRMPLYYQNAKKELADIWNQREAARVTAGRNQQRLKAHPIDHLQAAGILEPGKFIVTYANVLNKESTGLSRAKRDFILGIGNGIFNKTVQTLLDDEKKRDNSNGND